MNFFDSLIDIGKNAIISATKPEIKPVPQEWERQVLPFIQRNNFRPGVVCFPTSVAIRYSFDNPNLPENWDNDFLLEIIKFDDTMKGGLRHYQHADFYISYMKKYGYKKSEIIYSIPEIRKRLRERPIILATWLTDPVIDGVQTKNNGHIVCAVGASEIKEGFKIQDPFGMYPYKTLAEKNNREPYFMNGYKWWAGFALDIK